MAATTSQQGSSISCSALGNHGIILRDMEPLQTPPETVPADPRSNGDSTQQPKLPCNALPKYKPQNYHRLAEIMSKDKNFAIFRRFDELNMLHLMALQAEIIELRELFRDRCRRDDQDNPGSGQEHLMYSRYFRALSESEIRQPLSPAALHAQTPSSQLGLLTALRQRMSEYSTLEILLMA